jgi:1,5-anhydro-D-fructose reductase (1,5-anhydro-D-mannitol-forming)
VAASMMFENGVTATGHWNFAANTSTDKMLIIGKRGQISFSVFEESSAILTTAEKCITQPMPKPTPIQGDFVQAMAEHLAGKSEHPSMAESGAHTNWVMDEILKNA